MTTTIVACIVTGVLCFVAGHFLGQRRAKQSAAAWASIKGKMQKP